MNKNMILAGFLLLQGMVPVAFADGNITVHEAWIRAAAPNAPVLAGYMTVENKSSAGKSLIGAASPAFGDITIHRTEHADGVARMTHLPKIDIAAHGKLIFQPNGYHLMLTQPKRSLQAGDRVPMELKFAGGLRVSASFVVRDQGVMHGSGDGGSHAEHKPMAHDRTAH